MSSGPVNLQGTGTSSNLMLLPQLGGMTFSITNNAGWYDTLFFTQPGSVSIPLDISGINFHAELRRTVADSKKWLDLSTLGNPAQLINGASNGNLFFSVDASLTVNLTPQTYEMDMLAIDMASGIVRNLCEGGPMLVTVLQGVTR
jgi:hypothetical protein